MEKVLLTFNDENKYNYSKSLLDVLQIIGGDVSFIFNPENKTIEINMAHGDNRIAFISFVETHVKNKVV